MNRSTLFVLLGAGSLLLAACDSDSEPDDTGPTGTDEDGDGYLEGDDCDDGNPYVNPAATETCNEIDDDCDGTVDDGVTTTYWIDDDGDGYGDPDAYAQACSRPDGYATNSDDCDDGDRDVRPGVDEVCDGVDNDCDGTPDDDAIDAVTLWIDDDGDGYGDPAHQFEGCEESGGADNDDDCDDGDEAIHPGATEVCDGVDNDCDGTADDSPTDGTLWYPDDDRDGYGDSTAGVRACEAPHGYVADATDCNDEEPAAYPGAKEVCDGLDNDCDGEVDPEGCLGCDEVSVIIYYDSFSSSDEPAGLAAAALGATSSSSSSSTTFASYYDRGTWDVLVVDVPGSSLASDVTTRISTHISAGGIVLFSWWDLDGSTSVQTTLGVSTSSFSTPMAVYSTSGGGLWDIWETLPDPISSYSHDAGDNGDVLTALDATTSEQLAYFAGDTSQTAILATYDGQVLVNGFLPWDFQDTDDDRDGITDMQELFENEIIWTTGCSP